MRVRHWSDPMPPLVEGYLLLYNAPAKTFPNGTRRSKATCPPWMPAPIRPQ